jgi:hypothetical protein
MADKSAGDFSGSLFLTDNDPDVIKIAAITVISYNESFKKPWVN